ncbi:MAG: hypothetical protein SCM96_07280 [Acidobacteriota bacterium]|nr:hypothetical protein [Acidobacteriota bacterium]
MAAVEVLAVENVDLISPLGEKAGHVRLFEELPDVPGEKQLFDSWIFVREWSRIKP